MTDIEPQRQGSPLPQNFDLSCASELRIPGSYPVLTIRGHTRALNSLPADHSVPSSTLQDLGRFRHVIEHLVVLAIQRLQILPSWPRHIEEITTAVIIT